MHNPFSEAYHYGMLPSDYSGNQNTRKTILGDFNGFGNIICFFFTYKISFIYYSNILAPICQVPL